MKIKSTFIQKCQIGFFFKKQILFLLGVFFIATSMIGQGGSMREFVTATDTLVVYSEIPGLGETVTRMDQDFNDIRVISDKYIIKVRSAATGGNWINVHAHYTYNRGQEVADLNLTGSSAPHPTNTQSYPDWTAGWSHTYGNIEMSKNSAVEVEISAKPGFKIGNNDFLRAKIHPANKASVPSVSNGKVYFTITNPGQIVIDINGQMDENNALIVRKDLPNPSTFQIHAISLFANPVIEKPLVVNNPRTIYVEPGSMLTADPSTFDMIYFKPGVHNLGQSNKIYPGKSYYIPGDAIIFGTFTNENVPVPAGFTKVGDRIKIFGYGTISGSRFRHPNYVPAGSTDAFRSVTIDGGKDYLVSGITITDPASFSLYTPSGENGYVTWAKVIAWRANGDGLAGNDFVNDCFMRTSDDSSYTRGNRNRCTFWKDHISAIFYMERIWDKPLVIENCDIIYCRSRDESGYNGGAFNARGSGFPAAQQNKINLTIRNIRVHDPLSNMAIFNIVSYQGNDAKAPTVVGCSYDGILFQNIQIASSLVKQRLLGCEAAPFNGGIIFDNVTFGSTLLTPENHTTFFQTNEFVKDIWYRMPNYYSLTKTEDATQGSFTTATADTTRFATRAADGAFIENSNVVLTATPMPGFKFDKWIDTETGLLIGATNPISIQMSANRVVKASFIGIGTRTLTIPTPSNGSVARNPNASVFTFDDVVTLTAKASQGFRFTGWTGDVTSQNMITTVVMNDDKTVSASFANANSFGVNFGGDQYIAKDGTLFLGTNLTATPKTDAIANTEDDFIYQTFRASNTEFTLLNDGYTVENGIYEVTLKFAEMFFEPRVFNVFIEDVAVLTNFNIVAEVGKGVALDKKFETTVTDGKLNIRFVPVVGSALINALQVKQVAPLSINSVDAEKNNINVYKENESLVVNAGDLTIKKVQIYDMQGRLVYKLDNINQSTYNLKEFKSNTQVVLVKIYTSDNIVVTKKVICCD